MLFDLFVCLGVYLIIFFVLTAYGIFKLDKPTLIKIENVVFAAFFWPIAYSIIMLLTLTEILLTLSEKIQKHIEKKKK